MEYAYWGRMDIYHDHVTHPQHLTEKQLTGDRIVVADACFRLGGTNGYLYNHGKRGASVHRNPELFRWGHMDIGPPQFFVGSGKWDDEAVMAELRRPVVETLGDPQGIVVFDPSAFPKKGTHSCGVTRDWCGRLGKVENCQIGQFMAYATGRGQGPLDRRLYLPKA
jgi:hypothetical protein